jgi:hypothetical protein
MSKGKAKGNIAKLEQDTLPDQTTFRRVCLKSIKMALIEPTPRRAGVGGRSHAIERYTKPINPLISAESWKRQTRLPSKMNKSKVVKSPKGMAPPPCAWLPPLGKAEARRFTFLPFEGDEKRDAKLSHDKYWDAERKKINKRQLKSPYLTDRDRFLRMMIKQKNQAYFQSSGKSNDTQFGESYFPTAGIRHLYITKQPRDRPYDPVPWETELAKQPELKDIIYKKISQFFFSYFLYYSTLQQSAQLGGQFWTRNVNGKVLRDFVLSNDWNEAKQKFERRTKPLPRYIEPTICENKNAEQKTYEFNEMNDWLWSHEAFSHFGAGNLTDNFIRKQVEIMNAKKLAKKKPKSKS